MLFVWSQISGTQKLIKHRVVSQPKRIRPRNFYYHVKRVALTGVNGDESFKKVLPLCLNSSAKLSSSCKALLNNIKIKRSRPTITTKHNLIKRRQISYTVNYSVGKNQNLVAKPNIGSGT